MVSLTEDCSADGAQASNDSGAGSQTNNKKRGQKSKGKAKDNTQPDSESIRTVWLRSHPSVFNEVFSSLQAGASLVLDMAKRSMGEEERDIDVEIADLRGQVNVFEIMGPKSSQVLAGALNPVPGDQRKEFTQVIHLCLRIVVLTYMQFSVLESLDKPAVSWFSTSWNDNRLQSNRSTTQVRPCTSLSYNIPSVLRFPPKNAQPRLSDSDYMSAATTTFPSAALAHSEIWDQAARSKPRYKKKDLDERRSKVYAHR
jgi:ribonuclease P/MRP protein subunit POP1